MDFKLIKFDELLNELKHKQPLEENLSKIIRDIEDEFEFQSLGIFLKTSRNTFRLKISRNISHTYAKQKSFTYDDQLIRELNKFKLLDIQDKNKYKFEKDFIHLLIMPIYFKNDLLGFIFMDKMLAYFSEAESSKLRMFASIISLVIKIFVQQNEIEQLVELDEITEVYSHKSFMGRADYMLSQVNRYNRDLTMVILKIDNYSQIVRTIGKEKAEHLLKEIADILKNDLRSTDIIGKIYRDTFAVLMPESPATNVITAIQRLNKHISALPEMHGNNVGWGIAGKEEKLDNIEDFLKITEEAAFESTRKTGDNITVHKS